MIRTKIVFAALILFVVLLILPGNASAQFWIAQTSGTSQNLYSVNGTSAYQAWTVGNGGTIRTTSDGGANWTGQTSGTSQNLYEVYFISPAEGWISGANGTILH